MAILLVQILVNCSYSRNYILILNSRKTGICTQFRQPFNNFFKYIFLPLTFKFLESNFWYSFFHDSVLQKFLELSEPSHIVFVASKVVDH